jgi:hypothetical protein
MKNIYRLVRKNNHPFLVLKGVGGNSEENYY